MVKFLKLMLALLIALSMLGFVACGDDDDDIVGPKIELPPAPTADGALVTETVANAGASEDVSAASGETITLDKAVLVWSLTKLNEEDPPAPGNWVTCWQMADEVPSQAGAETWAQVDDNYTALGLTPPAVNANIYVSNTKITVMAVVRDDTIVGYDSEDGGDVLEVFLDLDDAGDVTGAGWHAFGTDDFKAEIRMDGTFGVWAPGGALVTTDDMEGEVTETADGYEVEFTINLSSTYFAAAPDAVNATSIGCDLKYIDHEGYHVAWAGNGNTAWAAPSTFGTITR
jgi:hypothetical protein